MIKMVSITSAIDREIIESVPSFGGRYGYIGFIVWMIMVAVLGGLRN